jgi:hypothetical protein
VRHAQVAEPGRERGPELSVETVGQDLVGEQLSPDLRRADPVADRLERRIGAEQLEQRRITESLERGSVPALERSVEFVDLSFPDPPLVRAEF